MMDLELEDIKDYIKKNKKSSLEFNIIWLNNKTKQKVIVIIEEVLKKHKVEKYCDDVSYIIMELISNAIKARYLHVITIKILREKHQDFNQKIDTDEYFYDYNIMSEYSDIFKDDESKKILKDVIKLENNLIKDMDSNIDIDNEKYKQLLSYRNDTKKKFIIKLVIKLNKNNIEFEVINDAPLIMISRTRIDSKRLTFEEYYKKNMVENFFIEQLDNSESAGFGLALCDLRLFNQNLDPHTCLRIFDENNRTHSKLILPIKQEFSFTVYNKY